MSPAKHITWRICPWYSGVTSGPAMVMLVSLVGAAASVRTKDGFR